MTIWTVTDSYLAKAPTEFDDEGDPTHTQNVLCRKIQDFANERGMGEVEFEGYTDQLDCFVRRNGRRRKFLVLMP